MIGFDRHRRSTDERGSMAIELAMIAPALLALFGLIFAYGRVAQIHGLMDAGTRDAARAATNARSLDDARVAAQEALDAALEEAPSDCRHSAHASVDPTFEPGQPVTVRAICEYSLSDAGLPGAPGSIQAKSTFVSMLDPNRGLDTGPVGEQP